jgi:hypothetical protein
LRFDSVFKIILLYEAIEKNQCAISTNGLPNGFFEVRVFHLPPTRCCVWFSCAELISISPAHPPDGQVRARVLRG